MIRSRRALIALFVIPALIAALAVAVTADAAKTKPKALSLRSTTLGKVIVDKKKRTLYMLSSDGKNKSTCSGACASNWPPAKAPKSPKLGAGLKKSKLKVITRSDGTKQLAYAGHPLYEYIGDSRPGDVNGDGIVAFGGTWHAVNKSGAAAKKPAAAPAPAPAPSSGGYGY
jgi:predicted lipoprotein with Yx(FWY)xxD motif